MGDKRGLRIFVVTVEVWCDTRTLFCLSFHILVADIHTTCLSRLPGVENGSILGRDNLGL